MNNRLIAKVLFGFALLTLSYWIFKTKSYLIAATIISIAGMYFWSKQAEAPSVIASKYSKEESDKQITDLMNNLVKYYGPLTSLTIFEFLVDFFAGFKDDFTSMSIGINEGFKISAEEGDKAVRGTVIYMFHLKEEGALHTSQAKVLGKRGLAIVSMINAVNERKKAS